MRGQVLGHTYYAKRVCGGAKLTVPKSVFIFLFCSLLTLVVCHEAKDDFITSNITAIHSRNTGVRAVVEGTCHLSL